MLDSLARATPVAVVTGSSSGIGRATALALGHAGYAVILHARGNVAGLQQVAHELQSTDAKNVSRTLCLTGDIACPQACRDIVRSAFAWKGRVDAWVNNAGADVLTGRARQQSFESRMQRLLAVDVAGTVRLCRLVAPLMTSQVVSALEKCNTDGGASSHIPRCNSDGGASGHIRNANPTAERRATLECSTDGGASGHIPCIVNMGWDQATLGMEDEPGQLFGTTKAAVAAFSTSLALSFPKIRVNCVAPGWIRTGWGETAASGYWAQRAVDESLQSRWGTPEDVAQLIAWLVSDASRFVNGQTVAVNGGRRYYPSCDGKSIR
ncbi:MAG: SDR family oxidoreductase [Pirellulaceae bacterium]|nr:SDR family oxidoreductase [Pirellulaceae bacterium]